MNVLIILFVLAVLAAVVVSILIPPLLALLIWLLPIAHVILAIAAGVSCAKSSKPTNTKLLWLIIIILAPFVGSLLWFFWGKKNT